MTHHELTVHEGTETADSTNPVIEVPKQKYLVVNEIFKRGKTFKKNSKIELDEKTAEAFLATGDIKEIK